MNAQTTSKIALITGANKGLGFGIARKLGQQDITVLIAARNKKRVKKQLINYSLKKLRHILFN